MKQNVLIYFTEVVLFITVMCVSRPRVAKLLDQLATVGGAAGVAADE